MPRTPTAVSDSRVIGWTMPSKDGPFGVGTSLLANPGLYSTHRTWLMHVTPTGKLDMCLDFFLMARKLIPTVDEATRVTACGSCMGRNGGCPGSPQAAPPFSKYVVGKKYVLVTALHFDMAWAVQYGTPKPLMDAAKGRPFAQIRYADRVTEMLLSRLLWVIHDATGWSKLAMGNCAGCSNPADCAVMRGKKCWQPDKRTFSVEAVGIDVDTLHCMLYGEHLPWHYNPVVAIPTYMSRYTAFLMDKPPTDDDYLSRAIEPLLLQDRSIPVAGARSWPHVQPLQLPRALAMTTKQRLWVYLDKPVTHLVPKGILSMVEGERADSMGGISGGQEVGQEVNQKEVGQEVNQAAISVEGDDEDIDAAHSIGRAIKAAAPKARRVKITTRPGVQR